jgi:hypothetical protein
VKSRNETEAGTCSCCVLGHDSQTRVPKRKGYQREEYPPRSTNDTLGRVPTRVNEQALAGSRGRVLKRRDRWFVGDP